MMEVRGRGLCRPSLGRVEEEEATHVRSAEEPRPRADHRRNPEPGTGKDADRAGDHKHTGDAHKDSHLHRMDELNVVVDLRAGRLILIHLEQQTPPDEFQAYGARIVPFYNYLQAAFVVHEDGRLGADGVLRVAVELVTEHRFDGDSLSRSYLDLVRRGHLRGIRVDAIAASLEAWLTQGNVPASVELRTMVARLPAIAEQARAASSGRLDERRGVPDYVSLVDAHNARRRR